MYNVFRWSRAVWGDERINTANRDRATDRKIRREPSYGKTERRLDEISRQNALPYSRHAAVFPEE